MEDYHALERQMKAVSNAKRLQILSYIKKQRAAMVSDIAHAIHLSIFATSHHLRILKAAEVVEYKKRGRFVYYRLSLEQVEPIKKLLSLL
ncbi:metalloregulator ArsR/SmtB family transcription factor [Patescibacteria group bacterium]|nr:metalloregulator ArsR/SmtB family transcription factor [Patescibacteria group bacterium]